MSFPAPPSEPPPSGRGPARLRPGTGRAGGRGEAYRWLGSLTLTKVRAVDARGGLNLFHHEVPAGHAPEVAQLLTL